jgi:hypothetical protein
MDSEIFNYINLKGEATFKEIFIFTFFRYKFRNTPMDMMVLNGCLYAIKEFGLISVQNEIYTSVSRIPTKDLIVERYIKHEDIYKLVFGIIEKLCL